MPEDVAKRGRGADRELALARVTQELPAEVTSLLVPLATVGLRRETREKRVGGKAAKLAELSRAGLAVPTGWVLDAKQFTRIVEDQLPKGHDVSSLIKLAGTQLGTDRAARARDRILAVALPEDLRSAIRALWSAIEPHAPWGICVRSSATCEDARASSLAGLATSVLGARGPLSIESALRQVWASLYLPRTLLYLGKWGIRDVAMPVVLQRMVVAEAAGVLFTGPPPGLEGARWPARHRVVHATLGLGTPVVDGAVTNDILRFDASGGLVEEIVASKRRTIVVGTSGLETVDADPARAQKPALSRAMIGELAKIARELEIAGRGVLDIEFAVEKEGDEERLLLLQARPVTGGLFPEGGDERTVWSRANVGEALPGAATPLTWSVAKRFSDEGFRAAFGALGCKVPKESPLVANVYGRFYLNLSAFMQIAGQVPGLAPRTLLSLSGGADEAMIAELEAQTRDVSHRRFLLRAPVTAPRLLARHIGLYREVAAFEADFERKYKNLREMDLGLLPDDALTQTLKTTSAMLFQCGELMLTCASASLAAHVALSALLLRAGRRADAHGELGADGGADGRFSEASRVAQTLTGGIVELESANPGLALLRVATIARREPTAMQRILEGGCKSTDDLPSGATRAALLEFIDTFGDRAVREAELATPRWSEDQSELFAMLTAALHGPPVDPESGPARARVLADREMARLEGALGAIEVGLLRVLIGRAQHFTRLRERMRGWVTKTLGTIRRVALDVDRRLRRIDPSLERGSVFFCTFEELVAALASGRAEIGHVTRLRRAEHVRDAARPDPTATFMGRPPPVALPPTTGERLTGLPASTGVVEGYARVLGPGEARLDAVEAGEILVSRTTDVGLSPLFLVAAAVVTELGGPLSHAAIVAREYGVPAVVNVEGATINIRTGDYLRVDGDRGVVVVLEPAPS